MLCARTLVMFLFALFDIRSHADIVAVVCALEGIAEPALRLAHQNFARSGHSDFVGMAERQGFEPWSQVFARETV